MKRKKGFTLIELMIVVAIIAIIASISIPSLLQARRKSNENAAFATARGFLTAAMEYSSNFDAQTYWKSGTTFFGTSFGHVEKKSGYWFYYFSDNAVDDSASSFCYVAVPISFHTGVKACVCDESSKLFIWEIPDFAAHATLVDNNGLLVVPDFTKYYNPVTALYERIPIGVWKMK